MSTLIIAAIVSQTLIVMGQYDIIWQESMTGSVNLDHWVSDWTVISKADQYCPVQYQNCWQICGDNSNGIVSKYLYRTASTIDLEQIQLIYSVSTQGMNIADASQFCELSFTTDIANAQWTVIGKYQSNDRIVSAAYEFGDDASDQQELTIRIRAQPNSGGSDCCRIRDFALKGVAITTATTTTKQPKHTPPPTTTQPTTKQPTTKPPTTGQPTTQQPTTNQPTTRQPTKQPTTQPPTTKPPTTNQPTTQEPTSKQPTMKQPTTKQPTTKQPATQQPTTKQPTTKQPTTKQPTTNQPTTTRQPTSKQPTTKQPTTKQPTTTKQTTTNEPTHTPTALREGQVREFTSSISANTMDGGHLEQGSSDKVLDFTNPNIYTFIAGAVFGGLLLVIAGLCCFFFLYRRKKKRQNAKFDRGDTSFAISDYMSDGNTDTTATMSQQTSVRMTHNKMAGLGRNRLFTLNEGKANNNATLSPENTAHTVPNREDPMRNICYTPPEAVAIPPSHPNVATNNSRDSLNPYAYTGAANMNYGGALTQEVEMEMPCDIETGTVIVHPSPRPSIATVILHPSPRPSIATVTVMDEVVATPSPRTSIASTVVDMDVMGAAMPANTSDATVVVDTLTQIIQKHKDLEKKKSYENSLAEGDEEEDTDCYEQSTESD